jgi:hypothetical protein
MRATAALAIASVIAIGAAAPAAAADESDLNDAPVLVWLSGGESVGFPVDYLVSGQGWAVGEEVTLTLDGDEIGTVTAEQNAEGSATPSFDPRVFEYILAPGMEVTLSGETTGTFTHTILDLTVDAVSVGRDTVAGTADEESDVMAAVFVPAFPEWESMITRTVTADGSGRWAADFSDPGGGEETARLTGMSAGMAARLDDDGNATVVWWAASEGVGKVRPESPGRPH